MLSSCRKYGWAWTAALLLLVAGAPASGGILLTSGAVQVTSPPPADVTNGALTSNTVVRVFAEQLGLTLGSDLTVNITTPGTYTGSLTPGAILAGTVVDSYFLHADPASSSTTAYSGSVTFDTDVLGLIVLDNRLDNTDAVLGRPGTLYPTGFNGRGLELGSTQDQITLSADRRTVSFSWHAAVAMDSVRVVTAATSAAVPATAVPAPGGLALAAAGALALLGYRRLRRQAAA
jgi:hypothetical protein